MEWAPEQVYETVGRGSRRVVGWVGDWVCNCCGRTFSQNDNVLQIVRDAHSCGLGTGCRLSLDFHRGVYTWMCGESGPLPSRDAVALPNEIAAGVAETPQNAIAQGPAQIVDPPSLFTAMPPLVNEESTNSFTVCGQ